MSSQPLVIGKFSLGMGDRFAHEAEAQLAACIAAKKLGVEIVPVWNKSNREHNIIGSEPTSTRAAGTTVRSFARAVRPSMPGNRTSRNAASGGVSAAANQVEGRLALSWAQNIWTDMLG